MKFESKFGLGEIVIYEPHSRHNKKEDVLLEVQAIIFEMDGVVRYVCRYPKTGINASFTESQLIGDPEFNQEKGRYKDECSL